MLSIIVTTYSKPEYLINALNGCISQDIEKEVLVVNDCGKCPPEPVMDFIACHDIGYVRLDKNIGLSGARNHGIGKTSGEWVVVVDEDDWPYDNAFPKLIGQAGNADIVYGQMLCDHHAFPVADVSRHDFTKSNPLFVTSPYKRKVWEKIGGYKVYGKSYYEDWNFWFRAYTAGFKFQYVPMLTYCRFEIAGSMCHVVEPYKAEAIAVALEIKTKKGDKHEYASRRAKT